METRVHFRVNVSGITRVLPRHLRAPFKAELERRLLALRGQHVNRRGRPHRRAGRATAEAGAA
jgi:hypothetical protein